MDYTHVTSYTHTKQQFSKVISEVFVSGSIFDSILWKAEDESAQMSDNETVWIYLFIAVR